MKHLRNKNIKYLILPMILLTIAASIIITIQTYMQYRKVIIIANQKIADIVGTIIQQNPETDTRKIIEILNSNQNTEEYQKGQAELTKYGIDTNETNSIISVQKQMKQNLISNIILIIIFSILCMVIIFAYLKRRDKKISQITQYINEIKNKKYDLDINENSEDELSNLKNELYKITVMLKEESEISKKDKENIKMSVEDISHQLKTPLTSITIMLDNLKDNPNMDANVVQFYKEKINLKKLINEIIKNLEIPIEIKNQQIIVEDDENASFVGDYKWQQEAITNIIKNCIEHNKEKGKLFIKYEENTLFTKITIRDEGEGISKEDLKHIFERFYKGQNSSENSVGIGLALAKNIIEKNNGMISCKSELDKGTEFVIKYMK